MGSTATRIPTGAPVVASPFKICTYFYTRSYGDDARDVDGDGEVLGKLKVIFEVFFPLFFLFFLVFLNWFSVFFYEKKGKK